MRLVDKFGRAITDLRISITDRCNYKCVYCRSGNEEALYGDLPFADYLRMARLLVGLGIRKIRITGGEPLLRKGVVEFVSDLAKLVSRGLKPSSFAAPSGTAKAVPFQVPNGRTVNAVPLNILNGGGSSVPGADSSFYGDPLDLAITTNGHLLAEMAKPLKDAGLRRVTVSMDAIDPNQFVRMTRVPDGLRHVLAGIRAAQSAGLAPVKINCVLLRGFNDDQIVPLGKFARDEGVVVRFIEFMPLEKGRVWSPDVVVPMNEIVRRMAEYVPLVEIPRAPSETARRYTFEDGVGEIGIIAPVSRPFCGHCSRIRMTSDGKIRTCLFSVWDHDLHGLMRRGASDHELTEFIRTAVGRKEERHHIGEASFVPPSRTMVHIGG